MWMVTSHGAVHRWYESAVCRRIDPTSNLRYCRYVVRWQSERCATWNASQRLVDISLGIWGQRARSVDSRWCVGGMIRCWLGRRQCHSKIGVGVGHYGFQGTALETGLAQSEDTKSRHNSNDICGKIVDCDNTGGITAEFHGSANVGRQFFYLISKLGEYCPDVVSDALMWIKKKSGDVWFFGRVEIFAKSYGKDFPIFQMLAANIVCLCSEQYRYQKVGLEEQEARKTERFHDLRLSFEISMILVKTVLHDVEIHQKISVPNYQIF